MAKIVFIGGGSTNFVREVVVDMFSYPQLRSSVIGLMDVDAERLERSRKIIQKIIDELKIDARVETSTDRRKAIEGADYIIVTIMVGGAKHYHSDVAIPEKFGVLQAVSDTGGPGGVFRAIRTLPVLEGLVRDVKAVCPKAWILNYANPMAMNCWAINSCGHDRVVGLCHSIQGMYRTIAKWLKIPAEEVDYTAAGINHINFYLTLERRGQDLYPALREAAERIIKEEPEERVRFEQLEYLGHFAAEAPPHQSEYYPWFRKNQALVDYYGVETYYTYKVDTAYSKFKWDEIDKQLAGVVPIHYGRSIEYGARIIYAMETGDAEVFYGNVRNRGLIENLPAEAIVEVPCVADHNGIFPARMGRIPPQLAAVMTPHIHVHEMAVTGVLTKNRRLIHQAVAADPLTGAVLTLPKIREMVDALFVENAEYIVNWPGAAK
jgi:alpha-galactosidase